MVEKMNLGVLFGGRSGEHEVSLMSARSVLSVLDPSKYDVIQVGITHDGKWLGGVDVISAFEKADFTGLQPVVVKPEPGDAILYAIRDGQLETAAHLDVVFPVLHGSYGEDGTLQGFFEMADLAYIGAGVLGSSVAMDKALFKEIMRNRKIPVVESILANRIQ